MGFRDMPRREFLDAAVARRCARPGKSGRWQVEADLDTVSRLAAGIVRAAVYQPLSITFPISGIFAIHARTRGWLCSFGLAASVGEADSGIAAGGTG